MKNRTRMWACIAVVCGLNAYHDWRRNSIINSYSQERAEMERRDQERAQYVAAVESYVAEISSAINTQASEQGILNRFRLNIDDTIGGPAPDLCLEIDEGFRRKRAYIRIDEKPIEEHFPPR